MIAFSILYAASQTSHTIARIKAIRLQCSLRVLMAAVTVFCVWLGYALYRDEQEQNAALLLRSAGARLRYDDDRHRPDENSHAHARASFGRRILDLISGKSTPSVIGVSFFDYRHGTAKDEHLAALGALRQLKELNLTHRDFSDKGAGYIGRLPALERLNVSFSAVNDAQLQRLSELSSLIEIRLRFTKITDRGLPFLANLRGLKILDLEGTKIDGSGFRNMDAPPGLHDVCLGLTNLNDAGLKCAAALPGVSELDISCTRITDAGLQYFPPTLLELDLFNTAVTDAGILLLQNAPKLRTVNVAETDVTPAGIDSLQARMPQCTIEE